MLMDSSGEHAFLASPAGGEAHAVGFGELLYAHGRLSGIRGFLPDVPGINGGSLTSANASGIMGQSLAAASRFALLGDLASDHAATQALVHASDTSLGAA
jgi:hypothetical protein